MLSFVLVNYNSLSFTTSCVESIINVADQLNDYEIIIVDNSPSKADFDSLTEYISINKILNIKLIKADNYGFGHANNIGIRRACGEYIFIINNDAEIINIINDNSIKQIFEDKTIGIIAPKVLYPDGSIQPNCSTFLNLFSSTLRFLKVGDVFYNSKFLSWSIKFFFGKTELVSLYFNRENISKQARFVDWASGCGLIFKKDEFIKNGMFDENFFMYYEDEELCYRFLKAGKKVFYYPEIVISHYVGASSKLISNAVEITKIKSEFYFYKKHFPAAFTKLKFIYKSLTYTLSPFFKRYNVIAIAFLEKKIY